MYVDPDYPTKKAFRLAVAQGARPEPYNPSSIFPAPHDGETTIEGPHFPRPHRWYARVRVEGGVIVQVLA